MNETMNLALRTIRSEHRSLSAVLQTLKAMIGELAQEHKPADFPLFWRMLYYIEAYPDRFHHPKEDEELFPRIRQRSPEAAPIVDKLHREHQQCESRLNHVRLLLGHVEAGRIDELPDLKESVDGFADFYWRHMETEEGQLLPLAEKNLSATDWDAVWNSVSANRDPLREKPADKFWLLLQEMVMRAPAPYGLGPGHP
jgi:hemerythrin-like domain-containing protein